METSAAIPVFLFLGCLFVVSLVLLGMSHFFNPKRAGPVKQMPYESGMDPFHDARRRFDVRFYLMAIAFLVFDVELLFLYPWAVAMRPAPLASEEVAGAAAGREKGDSPQPTSAQTATVSFFPTSQGIDAAVSRGWIESRDLVFAGAMVFIALLGLGFVYDWRKGIFRWR
jgi:NADH-quinone oxidoreductase subunit A